MGWWQELLDALGNHGARANTRRAIEERRRAEDELERFLARLAHPAGSAKVPTEERVA